MNELTDTELAYLAGFLDGDGCISITKSLGARCISPSYALVLIVSQSDRPALKYWQVKTGIGHVNDVSKEEDAIVERKPRYAWRMSGYDARDLIAKVVNYLVIKKDQAQVALKFMQIPSGPWGSAGVPQDITRKREECKRALSKLKKTPFSGIDDKVNLKELDCTPKTPQLTFWN
jgi:hypothetical protein